MLSTFKSRFILGIVACIFFVAGCRIAWSEGPAEPTPSDELALRQGQLADSFGRLETLMLKMAELDGVTNPRRAALLKRAVAQAKNRHVRRQLESIVTSLSDQKLSRSVDIQQAVQTDLRSLLDLLLSENRSERLQDDQARIRNYIKEIERILRQQRDLQAGTEAGDDADRLAEQQEQIAERTDRLQRQMQQNEEGQGESVDSEGDTDPNEDQQSSDENQDDAGKDRPASDTPPDTEDEPKNKSQPDSKEESSEIDKQDSQNGQSDSEENSPEKPPGGQSDQGEPGEQGQPQEESQGSDGQNQTQQQNDFPPRKRIQAAEDKMRQAKKKLEQAKRDGAMEEQESAQRELRIAIAQLEEVLRQLREEEIERMLGMLEGRFRRMLEMQLKVYEGTSRLGDVLEDERGRAEDIEASKLSLDERKIVVEAEKALVLLREEGSSVAFPEVVQQMRDDMFQVVERLAQTQVGQVTQGIEQDIIRSLEEMIEALQRAQQEREEQQQQQQQQGSGQSPDQALIDILAELKMIKAMEQRVHKRTERYARLLDDQEDLAGQATQPDLHSAIRQLGERQRRIHKITRDIVLGKNK